MSLLEETAHGGPVLFQTPLVTECLLCGAFKGEMECSVTAERVTQAAPPLTWGLSGDFSVGNDFFFFFGSVLKSYEFRIPMTKFLLVSLK